MSEIGGLIATPTRPGAARHNAFFRMRDALRRPDGCRQEIYEGFFSHANKNAAVQDMLEEGRPWIFLIDDDQLLRPDALMQLLAHDLDVVTCNLLTKDPPFIPYLFFAMNEEGAAWPETLHDQRGLLPIASAGMGGVLIKRQVFERIPEPWFDVDSTLKTDDLYFYRALGRANIQAYCDLEVVSGHIPTQTSVWPYWDEAAGCWKTQIYWNDQEYLTIPAAKPDPRYAEWRERMRAVIREHNAGLDRAELEARTRALANEPIPPRLPEAQPV